MNRKSVTYKCKILTPMFLNGANLKNLELRASSFKGLIRFWWRILNLENKDLEELKKEENLIFGDTNKKSKVKISIDFKRENFKINREDDFRGNQALRYLSFGRFQNKAYIEPGLEFEFKIQENKFKINDEKEYFDKVLEAFEALSFYGGVGGKNRNGFGCFSISEYNFFKNLSDIEKKGPKIIFQGKKQKTWKEALGILSEKYKEKSFKIKEQYKPYFMHVTKLGNDYMPFILFLGDKYLKYSGYQTFMKENFKKFNGE
jgi:CRISPR type III-B/RAMP module RAMP protein Cmr1